jgi:short-subunit dehydrogenase
MVALETIRASNREIASTLPHGLVAVFVGATNGVGEATVRQFAKYAPSPRIYLIGRSEEAASRIINECKALNPNGKFTFISKDTSLIRNVDEICRTIKQNEKSVNLLFLTIATLQTGKSKFRRDTNDMRQILIWYQRLMKASITLRHWLSMRAIASSPT